MKKTTALLVLATGITANLFAQSNRSDKSFEIPDDIIMSRKFMIELDKGNKVRIELTDISDLAVASSIDSVLQVFFEDTRPMKDSLADPLTSKRIDYFVDDKGRKRIRFQQFQPKGASFLVNKNELSSLRTEQDTVHIISAIKSNAAARSVNYFHFTFFLNYVNELKEYFNNNTLNEKLNTLRNNYDDKWDRKYGTGQWQLRKDNSITAAKRNGYGPVYTRDYLTLLGSASVQNYKIYFVPSFTLGLKLTFSNKSRTFKREVGFFWDPNFLFARDNSNKLRTYRNDFFTLTYAQGGMTDHDPTKGFSFSTEASFSWLRRRSGEFFDKNTFRLGAGKIQMLKTTVEPCVYFHDFFKGVTPGIRITQFF